MTVISAGTPIRTGRVQPSPVLIWRDCSALWYQPSDSVNIREESGLLNRRTCPACVYPLRVSGISVVGTTSPRQCDGSCVSNICIILDSGARNKESRLITSVCLVVSDMSWFLSRLRSNEFSLVRGS